jgi:hypothetical protein
MQNFGHNIGFEKNANFFRRKMAKIAENFDHNIDPRLGEFSPIGRLFSFDRLVKITEVAKIIVLLIFLSKSCELYMIKMGLGTFWPIFLQTHLINLSN